jgi:hypothetical protein
MTTTASARYCMARQPYVYDPLACTMDAGHDGPVHVAHGNAGRVIATWPTAATMPQTAVTIDNHLRSIIRQAAEAGTEGVAQLSALLQDYAEQGQEAEDHRVARHYRFMYDAVLNLARAAELEVFDLERRG